MTIDKLVGSSRDKVEEKRRMQGCFGKDATKNFKKEGSKKGRSPFVPPKILSSSV